METHFHCFGVSWLDVVVDDSAGSGIAVCMRVLGCLWPISARSWHIGTALFMLMYSAPSSALAALDMTALSILEILRMAPLLGGSLTSEEQKKWPRTLLHALASLRYYASLCMARIMSLLCM